MQRPEDIWNPKLASSPPIWDVDIPGFGHWINFNEFTPEHPAYDYAAYLTKDKSECILGLPAETPIRAISDGIVVQVAKHAGPYACFIGVEYGNRGRGRGAIYHHVTPNVTVGQTVTRGDILGTLYKDGGTEKGRLVHLHFEMINGWNSGSAANRKVDPTEIYSGLNTFRANPQKTQAFQIEGLKKLVRIRIANFEDLSL